MSEVSAGEETILVQIPLICGVPSAFGDKVGKVPRALLVMGARGKKMRMACRGLAAILSPVWQVSAMAEREMGRGSSVRAVHRAAPELGASVMVVRTRQRRQIMRLAF